MEGVILAVKDIRAPIATEMKQFESVFKDAMKSSTPLLDKITHFIVKRKGKQMRPMFVFLSAKLCGGVQDATYTAASLIELLHTATLVHDDVVDDANTRRGFFSLNAIWKNKIAVLVGDYLLSRGLLLSVEKKEFRLLELVSTAVRQMSEGELLQIEKSRKLDITEEVYYDIIRQKTASLIGACCASGASSARAEDEHVQAMLRFGIAVGMAFQVKDDLFDYGGGFNIGKPTGNDIQEQKLTLPLIHALNEASSTDRHRVINLVKNHHKKKDKVKEVIEFVKASNGIAFATAKMHEFKNEALTILRGFPESPARNSLEGLVMYTIERKA